MTTYLLVALGLFVFMAIFGLILSICFRTVVPTNYVHIVQSSKETISYGKGKEAGNTYYKWPSWVPKYGVKTIGLPVSVFNRALTNYAAYDKARVPFIVDIVAFFRITDSNIAAERVEVVTQLEEQLDAILQGAARSILARNQIDEILEGRGKFGEEFTKEVDEQLLQWGVQTVKTIELMDIRDAAGSQVIANIMAKKKSAIEMESRVEVANNLRTAQMREIEAQREVDLSAEQAEQQVGERRAQKEMAIGIAEEQARQAIEEQRKETTDRQMSVEKVEKVRTAEIARDVQVVKAEEEKMTSVIRADGQKQQTVLIAEGNLEAKRREAEGIRAEGQARADAEKEMQMAPVHAQVTLAKEIGENEGYQTYLIQVRGLEMSEIVGTAQAKALEKAGIKVIANSGTPVAGVKTVMDLFSANGGTELGAMVEAFRQTDAGQELITKFFSGDSKKK